MFGTCKIGDFRRIVGCSQNGQILSKLSCTENVHDNQKGNT